MATTTRTDRGWRRASGLALLLAFSPAMPAAEAEIYVTTGPDGIEVYSNLPRKPPGLRVAAAASNPEPAQMAVLPSPGRRDEGLASHVAEPGKSFLLDD